MVTANPDLELPDLDPQYVERTAPQVVLNKMTKSKFDSIAKDPDQLYAITDAPEPVYTADVISEESTSPWIENGMINDNSVSFEKMNWSTSQNAFSFLASNTTFSNGNTIATVTVPATGVYLMIGTITAPGSSSYNYLGAQIYKGSSLLANATQDMGTRGNRAQVTVMTTKSLSKGSTITLRVVLGASTTIENQSGLVLVRIA